jgi:hypothetical protein
MRSWRRLSPLVVLLGLASCVSLPAQEPRPLFDGRSLEGWTITDFGGQGAVDVREGAIVLHQGEPLTGITWTEEFPRVGYEVTLEAMRLEGSDFFAAITFPVGDDPCTLVIGGWGGTVVGLSSVEGADASENETRRSMRFEDRRWYRIRLRVTEQKIEAWIDDEQVVDFAHRDRLLSIRVDVWQSQPFGIATWQTTGALRNIALRMLPPPRLAPDPAPPPPPDRPRP